MEQIQRYLKVNDAAKYVGLSPATLNKDRWSRLLGIPYIKAGRTILYDRDDLDQWLCSNKVDALTEAAASERVLSHGQRHPVSTKGGGSQ